MKRTLFLCLLALVSCSKIGEGYVTLFTRYEMVESNSMVKSDHDAIVAAIKACNPESIKVKATEKTTKVATEFTTGEKVTLKFGEYSLSATINPDDAYWFNSSCASASGPFLSVSSSVTVDENSTALSVPATYNCYALVALSSQVSAFKIYTTSWTEMPSVVSGDYIITFPTGTFENSNLILAVPASEDYSQKQISAPKTADSKGKYFLLTLAPTGAEMTTDVSFPDWTEGTL